MVTWRWSQVTTWCQSGHTGSAQQRCTIAWPQRCISSHSCTPQLPTWRWSTWSFLNWIQSMQVMQHDMASATGSADLGAWPNCKSRRNTGSATRSWWTNIISPCMDRWQRSSTDTAGRKDLDGHTTSWSTSMKPSARRAQHELDHRLHQRINNILWSIRWSNDSTGHHWDQRVESTGSHGSWSSNKCGAWQHVGCQQQRLGQQDGLRKRGETATPLAQQPKTTEMLMSATGGPTPESTDK